MGVYRFFTGFRRNVYPALTGGFCPFVPCGGDQDAWLLCSCWGEGEVKFGFPGVCRLELT